MAFASSKADRLRPASCHARRVWMASYPP